MKRSVLCLILCVTLLSACSFLKEKPPVVVKNEVPEELLQCMPEPEKPSFNSGDPRRDHINVITYTAQIKEAGADCRSKNRAIAVILGKNQADLSPLEIQSVERSQ